MALLSICIPTFNRAAILRKALAAYVDCPDFDSDVEIVISDNASTDETKQVAMEFKSRYPNIKYFRNEENVKDSNFCLVLDRASGEYLKLMNDNFIIDRAGLGYIKSSIRKSLDSREALFFTNGYVFNHRQEETVNCHSFDDFIKHTSFFVTAIGMFGAWREDWALVQDRLKYTKLLLNQDDWAYQIVENKRKCRICTIRYGTGINVGVRSGYNWFKVHIDNYYSILQPYIDKGLVSKKTLALEHKTFLRGLKIHILAYYCPKVLPDFFFDRSGMYSSLYKHFKCDLYFYFLFLSLPIWGTLVVARKLLKNKNLV